MTSINRWKKALAFALMLLTLFYSVPALSSSGLFPKSDALFGVTMQEQGVSKILHLDLDALEKELGLTEQ